MLLVCYYASLLSPSILSTFVPVYFVLHHPESVLTATVSILDTNPFYVLQPFLGGRYFSLRTNWATLPLSTLRTDWHSSSGNQGFARQYESHYLNIAAFPLLNTITYRRSLYILETVKSE